MYDILESLPFDPDIICLSESRIKNAPIGNAELPGYNFINVSLKNNAGGAAMYIHDALSFSLEKRLNFCRCECLWLNVL